MLTSLTRRLAPGYDEMSERDRLVTASNIVGFAWSGLLVLGGLIWLIASTDFNVIRDNWLILLVAAMLILVLDEALNFIVFLDANLVATASGSLSLVIAWSVALLFGPASVWAQLPQVVYQFVRGWRESSQAVFRWSVLRTTTESLALVVVGTLAGLATYQALGGRVPLPDLELATVLAAVAGIATTFVVALLTTLPVLFLLMRYGADALQIGPQASLIRNFLRILGLNVIVQVFAILLAAIYTRFGAWAYLFGATAVLMVSILAHRLSLALSVGARREKGLRQLEALGRAIITAPPDATILPGLLQQYTQGLFTDARAEARLFSGVSLFRTHTDWPPVPESVWSQVQTSKATHSVMPGLSLPGDRSVKREALLAPINDAETGAVIGGIYVLRNRRAGPAEEYLPIAQSLAAQIASALFRIRAHEQELAQRKTEQELEFAARVQASFLPNQPPAIEGWQVSAQLQSAKETSGDFFDYVLLPNGCLAVAIADVADKGVGAALFMALTRTLIRTYARQHPDRPDLVLYAVNRHICDETRTETFVTALYGTLDPQSGCFNYCNAGHYPPLVARAEGHVESLPYGDMSLGVYPDIALTSKHVCLAPNDSLVLYTDGLTDAQNAQGEFFGDGRLRDAVRANCGRSQHELRDAIIGDMDAFTGNAPRFDDVTLIVIKRE